MTGIGTPYNVLHQTHAEEQNGKVMISKPARPVPPVKQTNTSEEQKLPAPKRPPPPKHHQPTANKPPRPPLPIKK